MYTLTNTPLLLPCYSEIMVPSDIEDDRLAHPFHERHLAVFPGQNIFTLLTDTDRQRKRAGSPTAPSLSATTAPSACPLTVRATAHTHFLGLQLCGIRRINTMVIVRSRSNCTRSRGRKVSKRDIS